ncbi:hypothetical protein [Paenibacillus periandrae]|nr:hypothetical protein [Paenibacillus periandrae]
MNHDNEMLLQKVGLVVDKLVKIEEWDWPQGVGLYGLYKLRLQLSRAS